MNLRLGKIRLHIHILLPFFCLIGWFSGMGVPLLGSLLALCLHEGAHLLAAAAAGISVYETELTPFGGVIVLKQEDKVCCSAKMIMIAAAGPLASLTGCFLSGYLYRRLIFPFEFACSFARAGLVLFFINLLPALPLDGGQIARAILCRFFSFSRVTRILSIITYFITAGLCFLSLSAAFQGRILLSPAFAGLYLLYAANIENRQGLARYVTSLIARRQRIERNEILEVETLAAGEETKAISLLSRLNPGKYHLIFVLSGDGLTNRGVLNEETLSYYLLNHPDSNLGEIIKTSRTERPVDEAIIDQDEK